MASIVTRVGMMKRVTAASAAFFAAAGLYSAPLVLAEEATESSATSTDYDAKGKPAEEGKRFLEDKKKEKGVITLPSGLMYKVLKEGKGTMHPEVGTPCSCHYAGTLINGEEFDSSYKRGEPTTFAPNQVRRS